MKFKWIVPIAALLLASSVNPVHGCSTWQWVKCGAVVAACAAACATGPEDPLCIACLGPLYDQCKSCIGLNAAIDSLVTIPGSQGQNCSSSNWVRCGATLVDCEVACDPNILGSLCTHCLGGEHDECVYCLPQIAGSNLTAENIATLASCSAWDYVKCAAKVAECAATCSSSGITSPECISCFGSAYDRCKGCLPFHTALQNTGFSLQGCSTSEWLKCAGTLTKCSGTCIDNGINSPQCFSCLGSSFDECAKCISSEDREDIRQLAISQQVALSSTSGVHKPQSIGAFVAVAVVALAMKVGI